MKTEDSFSDSTYTDQVHGAQRELSAFISAVTQLFGPEQARLSADDWLDESEVMDSPPRSTARDWRAVTVAASARLANRLEVALHIEPLPSFLLIRRYRRYQLETLQLDAVPQTDTAEKRPASMGRKGNW